MVYCTGTSIAAAGEGRRDPLWGVAGMLAGAPDLGTQRLPTATRTPSWGWVAALAGVMGAAAVARRGRPA
jgi:hypothetical protein